VIDVRVNDSYSNKEIADILMNEAPCELVPRSLRLNSSAIDPDHALVRSGIALGRSTYGSPTLSDQATLSCQSLKLGPGDSTRSHSADEFIYLSEIREGIELYIQLLEGFLFKNGEP
jgi:acetylornithine deacetylase